MINRRQSRRGFIRNLTLASAAAPLVLPSSVFGASAPSNRITLGFIGTGSHGIGMNLRNFLPWADAQVVALCDVDGSHLTNGVNTVLGKYGKDYKGLYTTNDWRKIVTRPDIDAVVNSTPDHWHVIPALHAARAGKDVFCEKPLTLTIHEGRVLSDTITRYGRIFQTASENRSKWNFLRACELVRNGYLGKLHTIRTVLPGGGTRPMQPTEPVPKDLDWNMWLGQAPWRPYSPLGRERCHYDWRWILDFSGGELTDWGAHINDVAQWGNNTEYTGPISVEGKGNFPTEGQWNAATSWSLKYEYANGVQLFCTSGTPSIRFEGTDGWIFCEWDSFTASSPELEHMPIKTTDLRLRTCPEREQRDFLNCIKTRQQPYYPVEVGHRSVTVSHLGNIAMRLGRKLNWDPDTERFPKDPEANRLLTRSKREPWTL